MEENRTERVHVVRWEDPMRTWEAARTMSGIEALRAVLAGTLPPPPIAVLLGMELTEVSEGQVAFTVEPAEYHYNPLGVVHGGLAATLLDSAMGCAVQSLLPVGTGYTTLEIKVNYLRAMTSTTGLVTCTGQVIHLGRRTAIAEARLAGADGKLYAHGTTTCILFRP